MRVISGIARGHKLKTMGGSTVRPTADRVKEAMFNIIANRLKGTRVLDLFAGSGALGIEAISRGAQSSVFIDSNARVLNILRENLKKCKVRDKATIIQWDINKNLNCLNALTNSFDLVFMDPPYCQGLVVKAIEHLLPTNRLARNATIIAEHEPDMQFDLIDSPLTLSDSRRYGSNQLSFFELNPNRKG